MSPQEKIPRPSAGRKAPPRKVTGGRQPTVTHPKPKGPVSIGKPIKPPSSPPPTGKG